MKTRQPQSHTGAARIALEAGVPLVPAGIRGTDDLARLGAWRVRYGAPVQLDDLARARAAEAARVATERVMASIRELEDVAVSGTLLAIDGDSLAHRAYHAIPKSIKGNGRPANALVGFAGFLMRLWDAERPERCSSAGTRSRRRPTAMRRCLPTSRGASSRTRCSSSSGGCPSSVESFGFQVGKAGGYEADDFLAAAAHAWPGPVTVVTSDRDAYQLVSDRVSILQPVKGVSRAGADRRARGARAIRRRARAGARLHRAPRRPVGQDPGRTGRRPEEGGRRAQAARLARAGARRRSLPADRGRPAALPVDRDDGRRGAAAEAEADAARLGARLCPRARSSGSSRCRSASPPQAVSQRR